MLARTGTVTFAVRVTCSGSAGNGERILEQDVLDFIKSHPQEINLGKVDQTWFLDLVLLKGREVPEVKSPRHGEAEEEDAA